MGLYAFRNLLGDFNSIRREGSQPGILYRSADGEMVEILVVAVFETKYFVHGVVKITTNAFYIRTLALAVEKYPIMVASLKDNFLKVADNINVGFAVNAPHGLVVPVIKNAHKKTLTEIAVLEKNLTAKARSNKLALEDMENEPIAISNLGVYGIDSFFGIVPPPTSTILTIGSVENLLTINGKEPIVRKMVDLSLAADNRVINPPLAAKFLTFITAQLQKPRQLI